MFVTLFVRFPIRMNFFEPFKFLERGLNFSRVDREKNVGCRGERKKKGGLVKKTKKIASAIMLDLGF